MDYKQVILVRKDLKLPPGKLAAQVAHAAVDCALKADKKIISSWKNGGEKKIVLQVANEKELREFESLAKDAGVVCALITDAGHTVLAPGTTTVLGIGPASEEMVDKLTANLKMY